MNSLKDDIKAEAMRLGFALVGVCLPQTPEHFDIFSTWLQLGLHGEMGYLASQRSLDCRADPCRLSEACRTIIVLAVRTPLAPQNPPDLNGKIAAYAWGTDYHLTLSESLEALSHFIEARLGRPVAARWYTDSGPILERELAVSAGLGWIGRNTCLIHPCLGSSILLAELLLDIDLEPDPPFPYDRCGSCRRCLESCPTGCILPNRTLDARRCISYLTIEQKGSIPVFLRPLIGGWVFGCDICQQVCPWNQRLPTLQTASNLVESVTAPIIDLGSEIILTPQEFNQKYKNRPLHRARRRGYLRNVAVALGNLGAGCGDSEWLAHASQGLIHALSDTEPLVRSHAAWALSRLESETGRAALHAALETEADPYVQEEIRQWANNPPDLP